jgi:hypothetical protein
MWSQPSNAGAVHPIDCSYFRAKGATFSGCPFHIFFNGLKNHSTGEEFGIVKYYLFEEWYLLKYTKQYKKFVFLGIYLYVKPIKNAPRWRRDVFLMPSGAKRT